MTLAVDRQVRGTVTPLATGTQPRSLRSAPTPGLPTYSHQVSESADMSGSVALVGRAVQGSVVIFLTPVTNVTSVTIRLRKAGVTIPIPGGVSPNPDGSRTEANPPFTLVGESGVLALFLDTTLLENGDAYDVVSSMIRSDGLPNSSSLAAFSVGNTAEKAASVPTGVTLTADVPGSVSASWGPPTNLGTPKFAGFEREWYQDGVLAASHPDTAPTKLSATRTIAAGTVVYYRIRTFVLTAAGARLYSAWVTSPLVTVRAETTSTDPTVQHGLAGVYPLPGKHCGIRPGVTLTNASGGVISTPGSLKRRYTSPITFRVPAGQTMTFSDWEQDYNGTASAITFDLGTGATCILDWCEVTQERNFTAARAAINLPSTGRVIIRRMNMHHVTEGFRIRGSGHIFEDTLIDRMTRIGNPDLSSQMPPNGWNHVDCIQQSRTSCRDFTFRRCMLDARTISGYGGGSGSGNSVFMHNGDVGPIQGEMYDSHFRGGGVAMNWLAQASGMYTHDNYFDLFRYGAYWIGKGDKGRWERNVYPPGHPSAGLAVPGTR